jgi:hypothetical protein
VSGFDLGVGYGLKGLVPDVVFGLGVGGRLVGGGLLVVALFEEILIHDLKFVNISFYK